jgi:RhtB (resistance to homoserine/threonine) family protein
MDYLHLIGTVALLNLLAAVSPGPDFVMAVKNSLVYSRRTGIFTAIGIGLGIGVHILYCAAGIGYIISKSVLIFNIIRYLGAAYLIYMGIMSFISKGTNIDIENTKTLKDKTRIEALKTGFLTNVLNPKATLFFLGLFTFVVKPDTPLSVIAILSLIMIFTAIAWFTIVAMFFTQKKVQRTFAKAEKYFNRVFGSLLVLLGIKIIFTK